MGADAHAGTVLISAIDGMAGIGKTALAVYWAQTHVDDFPDGQLYVDLRGYTQGQRPRTPEACRPPAQPVEIRPGASHQPDSAVNKRAEANTPAGVGLRRGDAGREVRSRPPRRCCYW
jgi:hypothetical protein